MKIAIDGLPLSYPLTGVGHYTLELAWHLANAAPNDEFFVVSPRPFVASVLAGKKFPSNLHFIRATINLLSRRWWSIGLPGYIRTNGIELFHGTNFEAPVRGNCSRFLTIHDLSTLLHPQTHQRRQVVRARVRLPRMAKAATMIITPTETIRGEVHEYLKIPLTKIVAIPEGVRSCFYRVPIQATEETRARFGVGEKFLLYVGTIEPRKNLLTLVRAFEEILEASEPALQLVIAGQRGWMIEDLLKHVKASFAANRIVFTGYLSDDELRALYSSCTLFVYPSLYEGFGLPPLEAMACGAPVIASRIPSLIETIGSAAVLIATTDVQALTKSIAELLSDSETRADYSSAGLQLAARYSWEQTARLTLQTYKEATPVRHY